MCVCACALDIGQASSSRMEEEMAAHSSVLAWRIPGTEEPGGLQSRGCKEVGTPEETEHPEHIIQKMQEAGQCYMSVHSRGYLLPAIKKELHSMVSYLATFEKDELFQR